MKTNSETIHVADLLVEVVRKRINNIYIRVDPAEGRVRVSAPMRTSEAMIRSAIESRIGWIHRRLQRLEGLERESPQEFVSGEQHDFAGRKYVLNVIEHPGAPAVRVDGGQCLEMMVRPGMGVSKRRLVMERWYRGHLRNEIPGLVRKWEPTLGVEVAEWRIKRMRTRWGTCNVAARRIWLNLELAKKPIECLEYVVVHEMVHLLERRHNDRFKGYMDRLLPRWREYRDQLSHAAC